MTDHYLRRRRLSQSSLLGAVKEVEKQFQAENEDLLHSTSTNPFAIESFTAAQKPKKKYIEIKRDQEKEQEFRRNAVLREFVRDLKARRNEQLATSGIQQLSQLGSAVVSEISYLVDKVYHKVRQDDEWYDNTKLEGEVEMTEGMVEEIGASTGNFIKDTVQEVERAIATNSIVQSVGEAVVGAFHTVESMVVPKMEPTLVDDSSIVRDDTQIIRPIISTSPDLAVAPTPAPTPSSAKLDETPLSPTKKEDLEFKRDTKEVMDQLGTTPEKPLVEELFSISKDMFNEVFSTLSDHFFGTSFSTKLPTPKLRNDDVPSLSREGYTGYEVGGPDSRQDIINQALPDTDNVRDILLSHNNGTSLVSTREKLQHITGKTWNRLLLVGLFVVLSLLYFAWRIL